MERRHGAFANQFRHTRSNEEILFADRVVGELGLKGSLFLAHILTFSPD